MNEYDNYGNYIIDLIYTYLAMIMDYVMLPYRYVQSSYNAVRTKGYEGMQMVENASTTQKVGAGGGIMLALIAIGGAIYYVRRR